MGGDHWSVPKVPSLWTSKPTFDSTFFMVIFLFERHFQIWTSLHFQIWTSISNLKVTCTFESHIWGSLSHLNVNLTFECHSHIWTQSHIWKSPQIWTSLLHLNVKVMHTLTYAHAHSTCLQAVLRPTVPGMLTDLKYPQMHTNTKTNCADNWYFFFPADSPRLPLNVYPRSWTVSSSRLEHWTGDHWRGFDHPDRTGVVIHGFQTAASVAECLASR